MPVLPNQIRSHRPWCFALRDKNTMFLSRLSEVMEKCIHFNAVFFGKLPEFLLTLFFRIANRRLGCPASNRGAGEAKIPSGMSLLLHSVSFYFNSGPLHFIIW
jgi:hypothetical protein